MGGRSEVHITWAANREVAEEPPNIRDMSHFYAYGLSFKKVFSGVLMSFRVV